MAALLLTLALVFWALTFLPAILMQVRRSKEARARRSWARVMGTIVRVETAQYYAPGATVGLAGQPAVADTRTGLVGIYEYTDPRGGRHTGRTTVTGVNLAGEPEAIPVWVNPHNWDESIVQTPRDGCRTAALWSLPVFGAIVVLLVLVLMVTFLVRGPA